MSEEGEYIVVNIDSDTDNSSDDGDELLSESFGSDTIPDTSSDGDFTLESEFEDPDDNIEEQSLYDTEDENEDNAVYIDDEEDLEDDNEDVEENILPENLEGSNPNLVVLPPKNKRSRLSAPDDFMHLENLLEKTNKQITHIFEAVSRMQESSEKSEMENCGYCGESFDQTEQASQDQDNPEETVPEPVAEAEPENLVSGHDTEPFSDGAQGVDTVIISSEQPDVEAPLVFLQPVDTILVNEPNGIVYPVVIEVEDICANTVSPFVYVPSNLDIPVIPEAVSEGNPEKVNYPPAMGNSSDQQIPSSSVGPVYDSEINEVVLVEMPKKAEAIVDGYKQTVYYPALLGNVVPPDPETVAASIASESDIEKLVLIEVPVHPTNIVDDNPETLNNPIIPENVGSQEPAAASFISSGIGASQEIIPQLMNCGASMEHVNDHGNDLVHISDQEGYLGDPGRNIRLSNFHLEIVKKKPAPRYAACYLANLILSEEILLNTVADHISHCIFTDPNKMSAIREYLMTVFPNYDLSEEGKDWADCLSAINFIPVSLCAETEIPTDRSFSVPISTNWNIRNGYDEGEGPSQGFQEVRERVIREIRNCEQNVSANPEDTDTEVIIPDELVYLGDPSRNIQIPYSVLKIAKVQLRPDLSAKYIILHLFPEEILVRSNVYGNLDCGLFALDSNRIDALQEFLQENYPDYDLEETEYYWKLCVTAINICLQTLRQDPRNVIYKFLAF